MFDEEKFIRDLSAHVDTKLEFVNDDKREKNSILLKIEKIVKNKFNNDNVLAI